MTISSVLANLAAGSDTGPAPQDSAEIATSVLFSSVLSQLLPASNGDELTAAVIGEAEIPSGAPTVAAPSVDTKPRIRLGGFALVQEEQASSSKEIIETRIPVALPVSAPAVAHIENLPPLQPLQLSEPQSVEKPTDEVAEPSTQPEPEVSPLPLPSVLKALENVPVRVNQPDSARRISVAQPPMREAKRAPEVHLTESESSSNSLEEVQVRSSESESYAPSDEPSAQTPEAPTAGFARSSRRFAVDENAPVIRANEASQPLAIQEPPTTTESRPAVLPESRTKPLPPVFTPDRPRDSRSVRSSSSEPPRDDQQITPATPGLPVLQNTTDREEEIPVTGKITAAPIEAAITRSIENIAPVETEARPPAAETDRHDDRKSATPGPISVQVAEPAAAPAPDSGEAQHPAANPERQTAEQISTPESTHRAAPLSATDTEIAFVGRLTQRTTSEEVIPVTEAVAPNNRPVLDRVPAPSSPEPASDRQTRQPLESEHPALHLEPAPTPPAIHREEAPSSPSRPAEAAASPRPANSSTIAEPVNHESSGPVREISMRIGDPSQDSAHLRVVERGGEVTVSVRSGSEQLARTLSSDLGELTHRLEQSGFQAELWRPVAQSSNSGANRDHRESSSTAGLNQDQPLPGDRNHSQDQPGRKARELWEELDESLSLSW